MTNKSSRRNFLQTSAISATVMLLPLSSSSTVQGKKQNKSIVLNQNPLKIGLMTYTLGKIGILKQSLKTAQKPSGNRSNFALPINMELKLLYQPYKGQKLKAI